MTGLWSTSYPDIFVTILTNFVLVEEAGVRPCEEFMLRELFKDPDDQESLIGVLKRK